eukprot:2349508-Prymnesium_polylepis.2
MILATTGNPATLGESQDLHEWDATQPAAICVAAHTLIPWYAFTQSHVGLPSSMCFVTPLADELVFLVLHTPALRLPA